MKKLLLAATLPLSLALTLAAPSLGKNSANSGRSTCTTRC